MVEQQNYQTTKHGKKKKKKVFLSKLSETIMGTKEKQITFNWGLIEEASGAGKEKWGQLRGSPNASIQQEKAGENHGKN